MFRKTMNFMNLLGVLPQIMSGYQAYNNQMAGYDMQISGAKMSAASYLNAAALTRLQADYNIEIDRQKTDRDIGDFVKAFQGASSTMRNQMATTGASVNSRSFLSLTNSALDDAALTIRRARDAHNLSATNQQYNAALQEVNYQNAAQAATYEAQMAKFYRGQAKSDGIQKGITTLLGGLFNG